MKQIGRLPLWGKYLLVIVSLTMVMGFVFGEILRISETKFIEEKIQGQLEQYSNIIVSATKQDLLEQNNQNLENTVLTITYNIPSLAHLCFYNRDNEKIYQWGIDDQHSDDHFHYEITKDVVVNNGYIGKVEIALKNQVPEEIIAHHVAYIRIILAASLLVLGCLCYFVSQYLIINPIARINHKILSLKEMYPQLNQVKENQSEMQRLNSSVLILRQVLEKQREKERQLHQAQHESEEANRIKTEFIATMSHEIRTPMNVILGSLEVLNEEDLSPKSKRFAEISQSAAHLLLNQLNDVLDFARLESGKVALSQGEFSPYKLVRSIEDIFRNQAEQKGLQFHVDIGFSPELFMVSDEGKISQILTNIVGNALKFTSSGSITIRARWHETEQLIFTISDTGIGIDKDKIASILQPFVQSDASFSRRYGGAGMGLAITSALVELLCGQLEIDSQVAKGTQFTVRVPIAKSYFKQQKQSGSSKHDDWTSLHGKKILLVEDSISNQLIAKTILEKNGFVVETALNGREAIEQVQQVKVDAVLMDLQMPELNGLEASLAIRRLGGIYTSLPIIAMTANASDKDREECHQAGMDDYLTKPINKQQMLEVLRIWLTTQSTPEIE
ncbi:TPA: response regulator [Photobacterium damselae]